MAGGHPGRRDRARSRLRPHRYTRMGRHDVDRLSASVRREAATVNTACGRASGLVVIPAAAGNRRRVSELRFGLRETFTATGRAWYRCLIHPGLPMPSAPGILWAFRDYE